MNKRLTIEDWGRIRGDVRGYIDKFGEVGEEGISDLIVRLSQYRELTKGMHRSWTVEPGMITESGVAWAASDDIARKLGLE